MKNNLGIFIFRKDLRLQDNLSLIELTKQCEKIIPIFQIWLDSFFQE